MEVSGRIDCSSLTSPSHRYVPEPRLFSRNANPWTVQFDGIIPADDGQSYLVTMHMSLTSFSWEYPSSPNKAQSAGLVSPTYDDSLYLPRDFVPIGKALG